MIKVSLIQSDEEGEIDAFYAVGYFLAQILWGNMELGSYCLATRASLNLMLICYSVLFWYHLIPVSLFSHVLI